MQDCDEPCRVASRLAEIGCVGRNVFACSVPRFKQRHFDSLVIGRHDESRKIASLSRQELSLSRKLQLIVVCGFKPGMSESARRSAPFTPILGHSRQSAKPSEDASIAAQENAPINTRCGCLVNGWLFLLTNRSLARFSHRARTVFRLNIAFFQRKGAFS